MHDSVPPGENSIRAFDMFVTTDLLFEAGLMGSKLLKIEAQLALGE